MVTLTKGFWMGVHEVTQAEYLAVVGSNPSHFTAANGHGDDLNQPVEMVSWLDATNYCGLLTQAERTAGRLPSTWDYRLATEAEWEYCCRAGARTTRFGYGDDLSYAALGSYAWSSDNSGGTTHPVEQKLANPWGLMAMHGNVWEWCQDCYGTYPGGSVTDPQGPGTGSYRVIRGVRLRPGYAGTSGWYDYARLPVRGPLRRQPGLRGLRHRVPGCPGPRSAMSGAGRSSRGVRLRQGYDVTGSEG